MKDLGLPLGFMNTAAMSVNDDGTVKLNHNIVPCNNAENSSISNDLVKNPKKYHKKKRGKKV